MERTAYNPHNGRYETVDFIISQENTTWFDDCRDHDIYMITDFDGDLLIQEFSYSCPFRAYDISRADIGFDQQKRRKSIICITTKDSSTRHGIAPRHPAQPLSLQREALVRGAL